jgi:hypothetical protein
MDHQVAVRVLDRIADDREQLQAVRDRELLLIAILINRGSTHVLHDDVRRPIRRRPGVEQVGDVGILEAGENLLFLSEALSGIGAGHAGRDDLDGDFLPELTVDSIREIDSSHPAASDLAHELVRPEAASGEARLVEGHDELGGMVEKGARAVMGGEQAPDLSAELHVVGTHSIQIGIERRGFHQQRLVEEHSADADSARQSHSWNGGS